MNRLLGMGESLRMAGGKRKRMLVAMLVLLIGFTALISLLPTEKPDPTVPAMPPEWKLVWSDDFLSASGTGLDRKNWIYDIGTGYPGAQPNWGTGEIEKMTDSTRNVFQDGTGFLTIKALREEDGTWTSGRVETARTDFQPPAGGVMRVEGRIQLPNVSGKEAQGYWPAFWMLGAPFRGVYTNWPNVGEIDIVENVNGGNVLHGTLHCGVAPGGPCLEPSGISGVESGFEPSLQEGFHTFAIEYDRSLSPEQIRWYADGKVYHTVTADMVSAETWKKATDHGFFLILNVAVGGGWPGYPMSATASGGAMKVDYVAVWTRTGS